MSLNKKQPVARPEPDTHVAYGLRKTGTRYQVVRYEIQEGYVTSEERSEVCQLGIAVGYLERGALLMTQSAREGKVK